MSSVLFHTWKLTWWQMRSAGHKLSKIFVAVSHIVLILGLASVKSLWMLYVNAVILPKTWRLSVSICNCSVWWTGDRSIYWVCGLLCPGLCLQRGSSPTSPPALLSSGGRDFSWYSFDSACLPFFFLSSFCLKTLFAVLHFSPWTACICLGYAVSLLKFVFPGIDQFSASCLHMTMLCAFWGQCCTKPSPCSLFSQVVLFIPQPTPHLCLRPCSCCVFLWHWMP